MAWVTALGGYLAYGPKPISGQAAQAILDGPGTPVGTVGQTSSIGNFCVDGVPAKFDMKIELGGPLCDGESSVDSTCVNPEAGCPSMPSCASPTSCLNVGAFQCSGS